MLAGCVAGHTVPAGEACATGAYTVTDAHGGARRGECTVVSSRSVRLTIVPEDDGWINDSPWYSFRLEPAGGTEARVELRYRGGHHRYWPKISYDGHNWQRLDETAVEARRNNRKAVFRIALDDRPVFVSAQEHVLPREYRAWQDRMAARPGISVSVLGSSRQGRPIHRLDVNEGGRDVLFLVGRQHPPEVSGAVAMFSFIETLLDDTDLALRFRDRYRIVAIPLLNPDGVLNGNWRHNQGGVDLNRDWDPFTQPETKLVRTLLDELDANGARARMSIDFHSTRRNLFYTQNSDYPTDPPGLVDAWLARAAARIEGYPFTNERRGVSDQANAKNYMYRRYGIPSVTYEVGDEADRQAVRSAATVFARELMELLLAVDGDD